MRAFVDTGALLALSHTRDQYHKRAVATATRHATAGGRYISTTMVLGEFHSHLLYRRGPAAAREAVTRLLADPAHDWRPAPQDLVSHANDKWLVRFADQPFSLIDAVSFEIMARESVRHAFAFDRHFETAGFLLLR